MSREAIEALDGLVLGEPLQAPRERVSDGELLALLAGTNDGDGQIVAMVLRSPGSRRRLVALFQASRAFNIANARSHAQSCL